MTATTPVIASPSAARAKQSRNGNATTTARRAWGTAWSGLLRRLAPPRNDGVGSRRPLSPPCNDGERCTGVQDGPEAARSEETLPCPALLSRAVPCPLLPAMTGRDHRNPFARN